MGSVAQTVHRSFPDRRKLGRARKQSLSLINIQSGQTRRAGRWMAGIGIAMEKFDQVLRTLHHGVMHPAMNKHCPHRDRGIG